MPNTPKVEFNFKNNNVQASTPALGISHVIARTTKGKFNDPSEIITNYSQFQRIFGEEIVPDGSISNIKKALEIGSQLRISRVAGKDAVEKGVAKPHTAGEEIAEEETPQTLTFVMVDPLNADNNIKIQVNIMTKEAGSPILDNSGYNLNRNFFLQVIKADGPIDKVYLNQFKGFSGESNDQPVDFMSQNLLFAAATKSDEITPFIEANVIQDFINNVPNIELIPTKGSSATDPTLDTRVKAMKTMDEVMSVIRTHNDWWGSVEVGDTPVSELPIYMVINEGTNGGDSDADTWVKAYEATKEYNDGYQLICSHIDQHLGDSATEALTTIAKDVTDKFEIVLYVEVPKKNAEGNPLTPTEVVSKLKILIPALGYSKNIAYFGGGIKYYDENGAMQDCDVLGSVIGLGDVSASNYGPWYSFSGMNRGVIADALGPVMENLGSPGKIDTLQTLAEWYFNLFVIKDTRTQGKRTMLWHGFTSNPKTDSERFLSIVRLNLYLKKNLRPILESYIDEPNIWDTWKRIYFEAKDILDNLVENNAMSSYEWLGDQDATSYKDLQINNEQDVRQGKYHVVLKYKDIVSMQEITIDIVIDAASKEISISAE